MPLEPGSGQETISHNIKVEYEAIRAKHPDWPRGKVRKQAAAIAYAKSRED